MARRNALDDDGDSRQVRRAPSMLEKARGARRILPFGWYGGKFSHLNWLLPLLPDAHTYCEPFGGSGAVLLNRDPSSVEVYNDIDGELCNFFRVLREHREEVIEAIGLTPFSREEFAKSLEVDPSLNSVERARRFYVRARQVRTGMAQGATLGRWANCIGNSRAGMSAAVSRWLGAVESLPEIASRLLRVQIENRPASEVIMIYDSPNTLFYCDPPYVHDTRVDRRMYDGEMTNADHEALSRLLDGVQGKVAISNYSCELMDDLYPAPRWRKYITVERTIHSTKAKRIEGLWVNYDPEAHARDLSLIS